jgi:lysophospholipase L1-like esterase
MRTVLCFGDSNTWGYDPCHFLNAGSVIVSSDLDGIHFEASEHAKLGQAVAQSVQTIFT